MKQHYLKTTILFILFSTAIFSQTGLVSGTLKDNSNVPLAGVNVVIKGSTKGTQTDFDGNYSIECEVGDVLVFAFVGMETREVKVTYEMFGENIINNDVPVKSILTEAYQNALISKNENKEIIPTIENANQTYNAPDAFTYNRIKDINVEDKKVKLTYFDPDVFFEIKANSSFGVRFFQQRNLPSLQRTFSQGATVGDEITYQDPESNIPFSYGSKISNLEYDGSNYIYDTNGQLVNLGDGTGNTAQAYDNSILKTTVQNRNSLDLSVSTDKSILSFQVGRAVQKDLFNRELSHFNEAGLNFQRKPNSSEKLGWDATVKFLNNKDNQPNINGFVTNVLLNSWITPPSFSNSQGGSLPDNSQRSFAPNSYNNPQWLLNNNINSQRENSFLTSVLFEYDLAEKFNIQANAGYSSHNSDQDFGLPKNTIGFTEGYKSNKSIDKQDFTTGLQLKFNKDGSKLDIEAISLTTFNTEKLDYRFIESSGFEPFSFNQSATTNAVSNSLNRNILELHNKVELKLKKPRLKLEIVNNSYLSSVQNDKWFLPTQKIETDVMDAFYLGFLNSFIIMVSTSFDINDAPLFYNNLSHNSLKILPPESLGFTANNDLFLEENLRLEEKQTLSIGSSLRFDLLNLQLGFNYFNSITEGSVFPVLNDESFQLQNIADISNEGFEISLDAYVRFSQDFDYTPSIILSSYSPKVEKLHSENNRVPIAGFSSTSKNLIVGQPAGVIVGSAYARDENGRRIIGDDGFPMVAEQNKIIGNPVPDFNLSVSNVFLLHDFKLSVLLDIQKGGDVWNGTQNVLDYFGTSQSSAEQRGTTGFIFEGVNTTGETNTTQVDFYNPENGIENNRFVRYGFEGIAEEAIVDGSYFNIKSIDLSYSFDHKNNQFIRGLQIGVYANNILTISKFKGATPYTTLYSHKTSQGLNFFNRPLESEVGLKLKLKI